MLSAQLRILRIMDTRQVMTCYAGLDLYSWKDYNAVTADLKQICQPATERETQQAAFGKRGDRQYP